jgi:hypothetical protein
MKRMIAYAAHTVALALGLSASIAFADTIATGPYYATPSWDQTLPSSTRFIVLSNFNSEAVLDRETGLVWERSPATSPLTWVAASQVCIQRTTGGRLGWRLPTIQEIGSLFDPNASTLPPLPAGHPFLGIPAAQFTAYWSATSVDVHPDLAYFARWFIDSHTHLPNVQLDVAIPKSDAMVTALGWCVRGGLQGLPQ